MKKCVRAATGVLAAVLAVIYGLVGFGCWALPDTVRTGGGDTAYFGGLFTVSGGRTGAVDARQETAVSGVQKQVRLLGTVNVPSQDFVFKGSRSYLADKNTPVDSPAARDLVARAMARPDGDPLYVVAIGCITDVASALIMEPKLVEKIVVVWLAGHEFSWPHTREFNMMQDIPASQIILDSGVPLVLVPCMGVASHLTASTWELDACLGGKNALCDALCELFAAYSDNHYGWAKEIWDVAAVSWVLHPEFTQTELVHSPILSEDSHYSFDNNRHFIRVVRWLNRTRIFRDMYEHLSDAENILAARGGK